ncbi:putative transcription factor interactor and regulator CCHC(Zn) family [Helianthus debilis subsp. tardiflorus]
MKEKLLFDVKYIKKSYDVLNRTVDSLNKTNLEMGVAETMMSSTLMTKQKVINEYIEDCAKLKQELETEKIENERIRRLLMSYTSSDYLIDRVYPTVAGLEAFQDKKMEGDTGTSSEEEEKKPFWRQTDKEFLAEKKKNMVNESEKRVERRTCFKCQEVGHIAWNYPKPNNTKQGVSSNSKMNEKCVNKTEQPAEKFKVFKNSTFRTGKSPKRFYKRTIDMNKQKWVVKSESSSDNVSDSSKSEESFVEKNDKNFIPELNDENFSSLTREYLKSKVTKIEISNQFFAGNEEFDSEKV